MVRHRRTRICERCLSELAAASEAGYIRSFSDEKTFFRITHVVKFAEGISTSRCAPSAAGFACSCRGCNGRSYRPVLLFGRQLFHTQRCHPEMETKTEQREPHNVIYSPCLTVLQYMFSAPAGHILVSRSSWRQLRHRIHSSLFTACMRNSRSSVIGMIMACSGIGGIVAALIIDRSLSFENTRGMPLVANVVSCLEYRSSPSAITPCARRPALHPGRRMGISFHLLQQSA